ncbi:SGNH/GDSL hydrolase family protein [Coraliomargarita parva]|uniref:SGNH/GDSL hydrolase family protein n=1 Tax=Coraliomargarita parva TaxID=3014050 RepID=UPI0022B3E27C|nr:GDSL-type esterase/lipase family protein [Coraliomargarita parva]
MRLYTLFLCLVCSVLWAGSLSAKILQPEDRIVFIGDSITGQGGGNEHGWVWLIRDALKAVDASNAQTIIPLGGSGHTVGSWRNIEKNSREKKTGTLDVKKYQVGVELDKHADVVVIMLGMNDVLSTHLANTDAGIEKWKAQYRGLLQAVRERSSPRVMALATPTPCTEDTNSPKNLAMDRMVVALKALAEEEDCLILPTRETAWEVLAAGRRLKPDFHFSHDQVHPNRYGHPMIAAGMLRGFGEAEAATLMLEKAVPADSSGISYELEPKLSDVLTDEAVFELTVYAQNGVARVELPDGWRCDLLASSKDVYRFELTARLAKRVNPFEIRSGEETCEVSIPAPWLLATANKGWFGWSQGVYDPNKGALDSDMAVRTGEGLDLLLTNGEIEPGKPLKWDRFIGNVNYGGNGDPAVVDFAQVTYFRPGEIGYGLRWIYSEHARPVRLTVSRPGFAGVSYSQVWLNGDSIYSGDTSKARGQLFESSVRKGWNLLSFKTNFSQWQWQLEVGMIGLEGDDLNDLSYSIVPKNLPTTARMALDLGSE